MEEQDRLQQILEKILAMLPEAPQKPANDGDDEIDAILRCLRALEAEQKRAKEQKAYEETRINSITDVLLRFAVMDFSTKLPISDARDEIDAIAAGLNTLVDEFQYLLQVQAQSDEHLKNKARQLEEANQELEAFSYSISHDLRAPLRAILGYSRILIEDYSATLDEEGKRLLSAIVVNGDKMGKLISDLLEFAKLGRKELQKIQIDSARVARSAFEQLNEILQFRGEIMFGDLPSVHADRSLLTQVYLNLIENAIKYSSKKEHPHIEVGATETGQGKAFYIKDNGAGFNMKYYNRLFEVFRRLHSEKEFEGSGVGLAIVRRIVQRHGGTIWAEGRVNEGATFYFTLGG